MLRITAEKGVKRVKEYISRRFGNIIHIYDPIYRENIWVLISPRKEDYFAFHKKHFGVLPEDLNYDHVVGRYSVMELEKSGEYINIIWLKKFNIPSLCHELLHCINHILRHKDTRMSEHTDEVFAYYLEFMVKEVLKYRKEL